MDNKDKNKNKKKSPKPKKEKIVWVDDGSTIADMSGVGRKKKTQSPRYDASRQDKKPSRMRDAANTYFATARMMVIPMLITMGIICLVFLLLWLGLGLLEQGAAGMIPVNCF